MAIMYCGIRAIQKRSWWRIALWSVPTLFSSKILFNASNMMSINVLRMYLKEDGETLVLETMLWEGTPRKLVVKIRDIVPHQNPKHIFEVLITKDDTMLKDHFPIEVDGTTYLLYKNGFG